jgi:putative endonuclease
MIPSAWIYILTNKNNTTLYVGVTNDLSTRLWEHQTKQNPKCFTARYNLNKLIYYEEFESIIEAIDREKYIKGKTRKWKEELIKLMNPDWLDLSGALSGGFG